jgi:hypothetical protein
MNTRAFTAACFDSATLFQMAARMEIPAGSLPTEPKTAITGKTFAHLRSEAAAGSDGQNKRSANRTPVSFDIVRRTVMAHTFERTLNLFRRSLPLESPA